MLFQIIRFYMFIRIFCFDSSLVGLISLPTNKKLNLVFVSQIFFVAFSALNIFYFGHVYFGSFSSPLQFWEKVGI
jgi:hypothetical protein